MLITKYNADTLAWEVANTDDGMIICEVGDENTAKQIIKDYKERNMK